MRTRQLSLKSMIFLKMKPTLLQAILMHVMFANCYMNYRLNAGKYMNQLFLLKNSFAKCLIILEVDSELQM